MRKNSERGAIVIEATISLTAFIFTIFTILMVVNIAFTQAKIGVALNSAAKEISQYSYLYYAFGADGLDAKLAEGTDESKELAKETIDGVGELMNSISDAKGDFSTGDFDAMISEIEGGISNVDSLVTKYADKLKEDPKGFIMGMGKMAGNELKETGKRVLCQVLAKTFMQKNLMTKPGDDADDFLKRNRVVDGMDGLSFGYTTFLPNGTSNKIQLVVTYDIEVIKLLNIDFKFKIRQCSKTTAWGNGVSKITPDAGGSDAQSASNLWQLGDAARGKEIIKLEKQQFEYTGKSGFHGYDPESNEFTKITTENTFAAVNDTSEELSKEINKTIKEVKDSCKNLGSEITAVKGGADVKLNSDPATRSYRVIIVVPDNADMDMVLEAVKLAQTQNPDVKITVRDGYGIKTQDKTTEISKTS